MNIFCNRSVFQNNFLVLQHYQELTKTDNKATLAVYNGRLFLYSKTPIGTFDQIYQLFLKYVREIFYKNAIDTSPETIDKVREETLRGCLLLFPALTIKEENKPPEPPAAVQENKTPVPSTDFESNMPPNGWVKQMVEAREGFKEDLALQAKLSRIASYQIEVLKSQIQPLQTENGKLIDLIEKLKAFIKLFEPDLARIDRDENCFVTNQLIADDLTNVLQLDLSPNMAAPL